MKNKIFKQTLFVIFILNIILVIFLGNCFISCYANDQDLSINNAIENDADNCEISVIGKATKIVKPTQVYLYCEIKTFSKDLKESKNSNFHCYNNLIAQLKDFVDLDNEILFDSFYSGPRYDFQHNKEFLGYESYSNFTIILAVNKNLDKVVDIISNNGCVILKSIEYQAENINQIYNEVLQDAVDNATIKAKKILNCNELKISRIQEQYIESSKNVQGTSNKSKNLQLPFGNIEITAKVIVEFSK